VAPAPLRLLSRAPVPLLVAAAAVLAWHEGGGSDGRAPVPHPDATAGSATAARARGADACEVAMRLVESLRDAHLEVPSLATAQPYFAAHWRKMRDPWARAPALAGQLAVTLSLRTNRDAETQWSIPVQSGQTWVPQARVWNMNEGSFDQREAIYAPTPATLTFRVAVPPRARLRFAPAVAGPVASTTVFDVTVVDAAGVEHALSRTRIAPGDVLRWVDVDADLGPWGGQTVQLRLATTTDRPAPGEKRWTPPPPAPRDAHAPSAASAAASARDEPPPEAMPVSPMALALWGDPVVVAREPTRVPYDVLWIVVDALRPDVAASLHDPAEDAAKLAAPTPPLEALLPAVPGLMPGVDRLAARGVHFTHAWSAAAWTRPGTLAMLAGERSSELGIDTTDWVLPAPAVGRYYGSDPPLLPLVLRRDGVETAAFVNNFFMAGYAAVGLDMGFERVTDHRYRTRDTAAIEQDALAWLDAHAGDRFFLFVNFNSPHQPYDPPRAMLDRVPPPPAGPRDGEVRAYMAEGAKDDAAIGALLDELDALRLTRSTLVVVTSDHGETLSSAHDAKGLEGMRMRFHHAVGNFEETTRVPLVMALPGVIDGGRAVTDRVRSTDIAPTVLDVEGLEADPRMSGRSLLPLVRGEKEPVARVVVSEGRGSRAVSWGRWRMIVHDGPGRASTQAESPGATPDAGAPPKPEDELYDLVDDPGERRNVARQHPDVMAEMRARLAAALADVRAADAATATTTQPVSLPTVHLRFSGGGRVHRVTGALTVGDGKRAATVTAQPAGIPREAVRVAPPGPDDARVRVDFAFTTVPDAVVGLDLRVDPPGAPVAWRLFLDDRPWPEQAVFTGPFGLPAVAAKTGLAGDEARAEVYAPSLPFVDPARDLGMFVTRDRPAGAARPTEGADLGAGGAEAAKEMQRVLQDWGYAHGSH